MTGMKRTKPLFRRTWIARVGKKKRAEMLAYLPARDAFLAERRICEARVSKGCVCNGRRAREVHHRAGRHGKNLLDEATWLAVCRKCHNWIHANANESRKRGFIIDPKP